MHQILICSTPLFLPLHSHPPPPSALPCAQGRGSQQAADLAELHQWAPWTIWLPGRFSENPEGRRTVKPVCIPLALSRPPRPSACPLLSFPPQSSSPPSSLPTREVAGYAGDPSILSVLMITCKCEIDGKCFVLQWHNRCYFSMDDGGWS